MILRITTTIALFLIVLHTHAQDSSRIQIPSKYLDNVSSKANQLAQKLDDKTDKVLLQMMKQEEKMKSKLMKIDSLKAKQVFGNVEQNYQQLKQRLEGKLSKPYIATLDTMVTSLKFLQQNPQLLSQVKDGQQKLKNAIGKVNGLEDKFKKAEEVKKFLKERKEFLKNRLGNLGFAKELKKINKTIFYANQQFNEFKSMLNDHKKAERKALELLSKTKLFKDFMRKNSFLASLFRLPSDPGNPLAQGNLAGLQTRNQVNNLIQQTIASGGPNAQAQFTQNIQSAQNQLNQLKNKLSQYGGGNSDDIMPDGFKPNPEKGKTFLKRIKVNADFQTTRHNNLFPVNSDLGLSIGYTLNAKSTIAVGSSFKLGWGTGFRHIRFSSEGVSIRGGIDWKLKGNLFIAGNYEQNYFSQINNIAQLRNYNSWKSSALLGLSKKYKGRKGKGGEIKLLYDFFYNRAPIRTQPIVVRYTYNLK